MSQGWRKLLTPSVKEMILESVPFRLYSRYQLTKKKIRISLEVTTKCNVNCVMCTRLDMVKQKKLVIGEVDKKIIESVLRDIKRFVKNGWEVTVAPMGLGEPLLYSGLVDFFSSIKKISKNIRIVLVTNGVLLDKEISKNLIKIGVDEISISLNVTNTGDYKKYIRADNYDLVKNNIKQLLETKNSCKDSRTSVYIQYLDYRGKASIFNDEIGYWQKLMTNADKCYVHPIVNQAGFKKDGITIKEKESFPCTSPIERVSIRIDGSIYPCDPCFYAGKEKINELYLGNVKKDSIFEMFSDKSSKNFKIHEMMKSGDYSNLPTCAKCNTYKLSTNCYFKLFGRWF